MTSQIRSHIEYLIQTYDAHFVVKIDEKFSINYGFYYDLMMILDSGLLFWATCSLIIISIFVKRHKVVTSEALAESVVCAS